MRADRRDDSRRCGHVSCSCARAMRSWLALVLVFGGGRAWAQPEADKPADPPEGAKPEGPPAEPAPLEQTPAPLTPQQQLQQARAEVKAQEQAAMPSTEAPVPHRDDTGLRFGSYGRA